MLMDTTNHDDFVHLIFLTPKRQNVWQCIYIVGHELLYIEKNGFPLSGQPNFSKNAKQSMVSLFAEPLTSAYFLKMKTV